MTRLLVFLVFLLFLTFNVSSKPLEDTGLKDCLSEELKKCSDYVKELNIITSQTKNGTMSLEEANTVNEACRNVTKCYGNQRCDEAKKGLKTYSEKCRKWNFYNYEMDQCLLNVWDDVYQEKNNCSKNLDFFSDDMDKKQDAYVSGKSCFLKIAKKSCSEKSNVYLGSKYENLLDLLTEYNPEDNCDSMHDEWMGRQCQPKMNAFLRALEDPNGNSTLEALCHTVSECWYDHCFFHGGWAPNLDRICEEFTVIRPTTFSECYTHIIDMEVAAKYKCVEKIQENSTSLAFGLIKDEQCVKEVMLAECDVWNMEEFDIYYKEQKHHFEIMEKALKP